MATVLCPSVLGLALSIYFVYRLLVLDEIVFIKSFQYRNAQAGVLLCHRRIVGR